MSGQQQRLEFDAPGTEVVAKANDLIRARHNFSTIEQRIFVAMVAQLDRNADSFSMQEVPIRKIASETSASDLYRRVDTITDRLLDQVLEIRKHDEKGNEDGFVKYNAFSRCQYDRGSGVIEAKFTEDMRPFLLQLKEKFTLYLITVFLRLRSKYSTQIYELLKMRQGLRRHRMTVEDFRHSLALEDKYAQFSSLKKRVIEQARTELKEKADIYFTYDVIRDGNSPVAIEFFIHENEAVIEELQEEEDKIEGGNTAVGRQISTEKKPRLDPRAMFKSDLTQEEVESLDAGTVDALYDRAATTARENNPDTDSEVVLKQQTYMNMRRLWRERRSAS
jgi:plasmid replication initiation protein